MICFITSKGTLDKANSKVRKYLAERADLVGAIRLPNNTFKASANTEATSDILFLKKKDAPVICEPEWIHLGITKDGIPINSYFEDHPEMLLGTMVKDTSRFGEDRAVTIMVPREGESLEKLLKSAVSSLPENVFAARVEELIEEPEHEENTVIPADPTVKNNTFTVRNGNVYLRNNASMYLYKARNKRSLERIKGMCEIREILHKLIDIQVKGCNEEELKIWQNTLTEKYDRFVKEYGYISDSSNRNAFDDDIEYPFICSLEIPTDEGIHKSKIFTEQTIKPYIKKDKADTAIDALNMVLNDLGKVDIKEILKLYDVSFETLIEELRGEIFLNPKRAQKENPYVGWETSDEYLSGNVREKLRTAQTYVKEDSRYEINVVALEEVQPKELDASEIIVRIGTTWIDKEDYKKFLLDILELTLRYEDILQVNYEPGYEKFLRPAIGATGSDIVIQELHMMSNINVILQTLDDGSKVTLRDGTTPTVVKITRLATSGTVEMGRGLVTPTSSYSGEHEMTVPETYYETEGLVTKPYTFTVVPQSLSRNFSSVSNDDYVGLSIQTPDNNQYYVVKKLSEITATSVSDERDHAVNSKIQRWYPGHNYTYYITISKKGIESITCSVAKWVNVTGDNINIDLED